MQAAVIDQDVTRSALTETAERVVALIRSVTSGEAGRRVPGGEWTVRQTAAHLVIVFRAFADAAGGNGERWLPYIPDVAGWDVRLSTTNDRTLREVPQDRTDRLADEVAAGMEAFLRATDRRAGGDLVTTPWYGEGVTRPLDAMTCLVLGEVTLHGLDMARALRRPWAIDPEDARLIIRGVFPAMIPLVVRPDAARGRQVSFDIRVQGGPRFLVDFDDGHARVEHFASQRVDCHILGDPLTWLLVGYGRTSQWGPISRGRLRAWGRRPWLALGFKGMLHNP